MPMSGNISGREYNKFVQSPTRADGSAVEVVGNITANVIENQFDIPENCDSIVRAVAGAVETYYYKQGGVSGTVLKTVTLTYTSSNLKELVSAVVT